LSSPSTTRIHLHRAGAEIEPHARRMRSLYLRDPDGNLVELSEPA
jgi:catechol 2,3-dioxygenase-like lactoylglutathione lyase family enzyme